MRTFGRYSPARSARPIRRLMLVLALTPILSAGYVIDWHVLVGGGTSTGGPYVLTGTVGRPCVGASQASPYGLLGGLDQAGLSEPSPPASAGGQKEQALDVPSRVIGPLVGPPAAGPQAGRFALQPGPPRYRLAMGRILPASGHAQPGQ
jgi:hypothetical protein